MKHGFFALVCAGMMGALFADEPAQPAADAAYRAIESAVAASDADLARRQAALTDVCSLDAYRAVVKNVNGTNVWTAALQAAVRDHAVVRIPASDETYWIDATVVIPSNRRIEASGARISLLPGTCVLMLRNEHAPDGTLAPIRGVARDVNIAVVGGRWEDWMRRRRLRPYGTLRSGAASDWPALRRVHAFLFWKLRRCDDSGCDVRPYERICRAGR